jgi:hypothetical protein
MTGYLIIDQTRFEGCIVGRQYLFRIGDAPWAPPGPDDVPWNVDWPAGVPWTRGPFRIGTVIDKHPPDELVIDWADEADAK